MRVKYGHVSESTKNIAADLCDISEGRNSGTWGSTQKSRQYVHRPRNCSGCLAFVMWELRGNICRRYYRMIWLYPLDDLLTVGSDHDRTRFNFAT